MLKRVITTTGPIYVDPSKVSAIFPPGGGSGLIDNYCMMAIGPSHFQVIGTVDDAYDQLTAEDPTTHAQETEHHELITG